MFSKKRAPIIIGGQQIGRFRASILLFKESFRFLRADKEIVALPVIMLFFQIFLIGILCFAFFAGWIAFGSEGEDLTTQESMTVYLFVFGIYMIGAFSLAFSQAGITHIVYTRIRGGDTTLGNALSVALSHAPALFLWAVITSTVGIILGAIAERSQILGKIVTWFLGVAWTVLTYFTVQAIVLDKKNVPNAIRHSSAVFRKTWGETLVSNISLGLVFFCAHLAVLVSAIGLSVFLIALPSDLMSGLMVVWFLVALWVLVVLWFFVATLVHASLESILRVLLYVYATDSTIPTTTNFNAELLGQILGTTKPPEAPNTVPQAPPIQ